MKEHLFVLIALVIAVGCVQQQETTTLLTTIVTTGLREETSISAEETSTTEPAASTVPVGTFIAKTSDVPPGSSHDFTYAGEKAILVNVNGEYHAYVNKCTHQGCPLSLLGGLFECPCHRARFDPSTGEVLSGPADRPIEGIDIFIDGDNIYAE